MKWITLSGKPAHRPEPASHLVTAACRAGACRRLFVIEPGGIALWSKTKKTRRGWAGGLESRTGKHKRTPALGPSVKVSLLPSFGGTPATRALARSPLQGAM